MNKPKSEIRRRIPELRKQLKAVQSELESLETAAANQTKYSHLVDSLADFRGRVRARADTLDVVTRQKILRLLVKEILVDKDSITIRHSIPVVPGSGPNDTKPPAPESPTPKLGPNYLLRSGGNRSPEGLSHAEVDRQSEK